MKPLQKKNQASHFQLPLVMLFLSFITFAQQQTVPQQSVIKFSAKITDKTKHTVRGLSSNDFLLVEGDTPQTIAFFSNEELPISYGLVLDCTGSMRNLAKEMIETAKTIINQNKPHDETFIVILLDGATKPIIDWTSDKKLLLNSLDTINEAKGRCSITDALYSCNSFFAARPNQTENKYRQRALILLSDGLEIEGKHTANQLIKLLQETDAQVFAISFYEAVRVNQVWYERARDRREKAKYYLEEISKETGGRAFSPRSPDESQKSVEQILDSMRYQYILGYAPTLSKDNKSSGKARVKLNQALSKNKYSISTRQLPSSSQTK
jgi:Ca-activated chloride channel homolog